jgi:hypothetical protein
VREDWEENFLISLLLATPSSRAPPPLTELPHRLKRQRGSLFPRQLQQARSALGRDEESSSPYPDPAGGSTDTSSAGIRHLPIVAQGTWGSCIDCPMDTVPCLCTRSPRSSELSTRRTKLRRGLGAWRRPRAILCRSQVFF